MTFTNKLKVVCALHIFLVGFNTHYVIADAFDKEWFWVVVRLFLVLISLVLGAQAYKQLRKQTAQSK